MPTKKSLNEILIEFRSAHDDKYDYSQVEYVNTATKVKVICPTHGEFLITPGHHKKGTGCSKCYFDSQKITTKGFIERATIIWNGIYAYDSIKQLEYPPKRIKIFCQEHQISFEQEFQNHLSGHTGCPRCKSYILSGSSDQVGSISTQEDLNARFIERAIETHDSKYDYSEFEYINTSTKGKIICPKHGVFHQTPSNHLKGHNCPECAIESQKEGTFKLKCKELGVNYHRALKRRQAGLTVDKVFSEDFIRSERETNPITVYNKRYPNLRAALRELKHTASAKTIARWLAEGLTPEQAFERIPNPGYAEGIIYLIENSVTTKNYVGLTIQTLERRWSDHVQQANLESVKSNNSLHAAIREFGPIAFTIKEIDKGTSKKDLEKKERKWIKKLSTLIPNGYNISTGGVSGGSNKKPIEIDNIKFESVYAASEHLARTRDISLHAAKRRIAKGRIDIKTPAKPGHSLIEQYRKAYKAWESMKTKCNVNSKNYKGLKMTDEWSDFQTFLDDMGEPDDKELCFMRKDLNKDFYPANCEWVTRTEFSKRNAVYMKQNNLFGHKTKGSRVGKGELHP